MQSMRMALCVTTVQVCSCAHPWLLLHDLLCEVWVRSLQPQARVASLRAPRRRPCHQATTAEWVLWALTARYGAAAKSGSFRKR